jgi:hypothetical protein
MVKSPSPSLPGSLPPPVVPAPEAPAGAAVPPPAAPAEVPPAPALCWLVPAPPLPPSVLGAPAVGLSGPPPADVPAEVVEAPALAGKVAPPPAMAAAPAPPDSGPVVELGDELPQFGRSPKHRRPLATATNPTPERCIYDSSEFRANGMIRPRVWSGPRQKAAHVDRRQSRELAQPSGPAGNFCSPGAAN